MSQSQSSNQQWAGQKLGLPEKGSGSLAKTGRRVVALVIDWYACLFLAWAFFPRSSTGFPDNLATTMIFFAEQIILLSTAQASIGHRIMGLKLVRLSGAEVGVIPAVIRTVLLLAVIPAVIWDNDNRGLHDKAAKTVLVLR